MKADRSSAMVSLNTLQTTISLNIYKNSANKFGRKTGFKIKNEIEDHYQSIPKLTGMLTELRCIFGQNLEILTSTGGEWSCGQAQNCVNFDFQVKFDLEGQGQSTPKTIGILTKLFCMSGSNLVILAGTSDKLSRGQARDWCPHGQTQATTIPEGQNWPRVKTKICLCKTHSSIRLSNGRFKTVWGVSTSFVAVNSCTHFVNISRIAGKPSHFHCLYITHINNSTWPFQYKHTVVVLVQNLSL